MTDMLYEKQGSYMQGQEDLVKTLIDAGKITADEAEHYIKISKEQRQKKEIVCYGVRKIVLSFRTQIRPSGYSNTIPQRGQGAIQNGFQEMQ